uniref:Xanthine dehydrogenase small subunit n=1 Tax=Candidatus Kentrum sp. TUN TaxID=2126343 RepID=A0A451AMM7_9GAMM|nr:MAG: xanthine dehydrogenase small subunit [Candidatus Kentron sp. TUN]VFK67294.1 MAG: xanthine dehydrogenase small subunit [Candidatus Kentron sp. TUN]
MIDFILDDRNIRTSAPPSGVVLDFLRKSQRVVGVKESCLEGACGACLVLVGESHGGIVSYRSMNSCLLPLGEIEGRHVVTIEGLNRDDDALNPIQQAMVDEGATQCGYCTPGVVLALTGLFLGKPHFGEEQAIAAISGNICRCTGYQSIKRAAKRLCGILPPSDAEDDTPPIKRLVEKGILPAYFLQIPDRLRKLSLHGESPIRISPQSTIVGGGTALWVQKDTKWRHSDLVYLSRRKELKGIRIDDDYCHIGAATTLDEIQDSPIMQGLFPRIREYFQLIASQPIRHRITVGGNIADAAPFADMAIFFLATGASIILNNAKIPRELALKDFFKGYRKTDRRGDELLGEIRFPVPAENTLFNFENISKRAHLDIASVNSAIQITMNQGVMEWVHLSAGGVAPIPFYLADASRYLIGREPDVESVRGAAAIAQSEIVPISDVRGSAEYKRLLLRQLIYAHFITLFPERITLEALIRPTNASPDNIDTV